MLRLEERARLLLALGVTAVLLGARMEPALAARACNGPSNDALGAGFVSDLANNINGTQAGVVVRIGHLCTPQDTDDGRFSSAWTMVSDSKGSEGGFGGYAQAGYWNVLESANTEQLRVFSQFARHCEPGDCNPVTKQYLSNSITGAITNSVTYEFRTVRFVSGDGKTRMEVCPAGDTETCFVMDTTPFDYKATNPPYFPWEPRSQAIGESNNSGNDIPGVSGTEATFKNLEVRHGTNWATETAWNAVNHYPTRYHKQWVVTNERFDVWTDPT